jgi:hypothetical protein
MRPLVLTSRKRLDAKLERQLTNGKVRELLAATKIKKKQKKTKTTTKTVLVNVYVRKANGL